MKKNKVSLKNRIFNLIGIVIIIILLFYIMVVIVMRQMVQENIRIQNETMLRMVTDQIEDTVNTPVEFIRNVNDLMANDYPLDGEVVADYLETIQKSYSYVSEIHIISNDGHIINSAPFERKLIGNSVIFEPFYKKGNVGEDYWSEVYISSNREIPTLSLAITEADYMIIVDFDLLALPITLNEGLFEQIQHIFILDQWGTYIVADDYEKVEARFRYEHFDELSLKDLGPKEVINDRYNVGYKKIEGLNWYIVFEFDNVNIYQNLNGFTIVLFALWGIMAIAVYLFIKRYFSDVNRELLILQKRVFSFLHSATNQNEYSNDDVLEMKFQELSNLNEDFGVMMKMILERQSEIMTINTNLENTVLERTRNLEEINTQLEEEICEKERAEEEVRSINDNLDQQVKIRTQELEFLNNVLQKSVEIAEQANKAKSRFLSTMSHEMRTPLNGILGFLQIMKTTKLDKEQEEMVSLIDGSSTTLLALINDILEVEKYSEGKMIFEEESVNLKNILEDSIKLYQVLIKNKGLDFVLDLSKDLDINVKVDQMKLKQLITNLLSNAMKFTTQGRIYVKFEGTVKNNKVFFRMVITDTGIGIKEEVKQYLFTPYTQADAKVAKEFGGTGLGLSICKEIVLHYEGKIYFESNYGVGTTFFVNLKLQKAAKTKAYENEVNVIDNKEPKINGQYKHILVVEDNITNQLVISKYLQKLNLDYAVANNGKEAVEMLRRKEFDLILMDCQMPIMDGFEATQLIRSELKNSIKIIAMTAYTSKEDQEKCKQAGMDEYLSKPINLDKLADMIGISVKIQDLKKQAELSDDQGRIDKEAKILMQKLPFDYDTCHELVELYINQLKEGLSEIDMIIEQKDFIRLGKKVHQLKGASAAARQDDIMKKFENIERLLPGEQLEDIIACLQEIKDNHLCEC